MAEVEGKWVEDGTGSMYAACVRVRVRARVWHVCTACTVCAGGQAGGRGACINMPRFGRTAVSLYSLGLWWCGKGVWLPLPPFGRAGLMRLSPDLVREHLICRVCSAGGRRAGPRYMDHERAQGMGRI